MSELEEKLTALMSNPQLMQQIAAIAQSMGHPAQELAPQAEPSSSPDPQHLQAMANTMNQYGVDRNQQALLQALSPYLSTIRIQKLERAMRAAKMAGIASLFLNSGGLQLLTGR